MFRGPLGDTVNITLTAAVRSGAEHTAATARAPAARQLREAASAVVVAEAAHFEFVEERGSALASAALYFGVAGSAHANSSVTETTAPVDPT